MNAEQEALVLSVRPLAYYIAGKHTPARPLEREDLAQAGLAELCRKIDSWPERGSFAAWAGTVMGNAMRRENQSMTWRRQSKLDLGRSLRTRSDLGLLLDYGYAEPVQGESGQHGASNDRWHEQRRLRDAVRRREREALVSAPPENAERPSSLSGAEASAPGRSVTQSDCLRSL